MARMSQGGADMDFGDVSNENMNSLSVPELIASLKSAFQSKYFSEVEATLVSREEKLKREIEAKVQEIDLLKKKNELLEEKCAIETFAKLKAEKELEECRRDCFKLKELNSRMTEEQNEFNDILNGIVEDKNIIIELKRKNCELECAKLRAETEIEVYKKKFEELETHVFRLEKSWMPLNGVEPLGSTSDRVSGDILRDKGFSEDQKSYEKDKNVDANDNMHLDLEADGSPCSRVLKDGSGDMDIAGEKKMSDSEEVESGPNVGKKCEMLVKQLHEIGRGVNVDLGKNAGPSCCPVKDVDIIMDTAEEKRVSQNGEVENRIDVEVKSEKIVINDSEPNEGPGSSNRTDTYRGSGTHLIVEIDSDDNSAPPETSTVREMATPVSADNVHSRQAVIKNCTKEVLKRKRDLCQKRDLFLNEGDSSSSSSSSSYSEDELDLSVDYLSMIRSFQ
ncbi:uncharacterized protein LOC105645704 isoform X2 [Jatropha curcas]|uniref:uncharacterized protein LOC105645704 isoform X2 n=1 Tax=Jatropha curcas TaxID=180498 RepID=UPI0009D70FB4|nr:uncharacterized protein LOC105645704 isoform X2 [Jatropha curcas]